MAQHDITHGMSKDKRYWRWMIIHNRCYKEKNPAYSSYGAKGIRVVWDWHRDNPEGLGNFIEWLETKLKEANNPQKYIVALQDKTKHYGPSNCIVTTQQHAIQRRAMNTFTSEQVVEMRKYKREHPEVTLEEMVEQFGGTSGGVSRALTGVTYANVDAIEPPIPFEYKVPVRKRPKKRKRKPTPKKETYSPNRIYRSGQLVRPSLKQASSGD